MKSLAQILHSLFLVLIPVSTDAVVLAQISVSSLNRHAVATREDVGMSKAECLKVSQLCLQIDVCLGQAHVSNVFA